MTLFNLHLIHIIILFYNSNIINWFRWKTMSKKISIIYRWLILRRTTEEQQKEAEEDEKEK